MPIYLVTVQGNTPVTRIVDATTKAVAINHVIKDIVSASTLTASEVVAHMKAGVNVEETKEAVENKEVEKTDE